MRNMMTENPYLLAPSDTDRATYIFGNRFKALIESENATETWFNTPADQWYVATTSSNDKKSGFDILHETLNFNGSLGENINFKHAGISAMLICCSLIADNARHHGHLVIFSNSQSAVRALQDHRVKYKML